MAKRKKGAAESVEIGHVTSEEERRAALEMSVGVFSGFWEGIERQGKDRSTLPDDMVRICRKDGKIVSHAALIDKKMRVGSAVIRVCGVGGVSTHPKHRHQGCALALMQDAIRCMREKGYAASMLFSGAHELYRKCGYESAIPEFRAEIFTRQARRAAADGRVRKARQSDISAMSRLYDRSIKGQTGPMLRSRRDWELALKQGVWLVAEKEGHLIGYARFNKRWSRGEKLRVDDSGAESSSSAKFLLAGLGRRAHSEGFHTLDLTGPPEHAVIREVVICGGQSIWGRGEYQMMRAIDLGHLLGGISQELGARIRKSELARDKLALMLKTDIGTARLDIERGQVTVAAPKKRRQGGAATILEKFLIQLVMGYRSIEEVAEEEGVVIPRSLRRPLEVLFPVGHAHVWHVDRF